jgi:ABC-type uncharacterized transport system substrate-binding protein
VKRIVTKILVVLLLSFFFATAAMAAGKEASPLLAKDGKKWRIGYCESTRFVNYAEHLYALVRGLAALGWIQGAEQLPYKPGQDDTRALWDWLASHNVGPHIEFVDTAYYTYDGINPAAQKRKTDEIIRRLNQKKDIDLMIVMGTVAGKLVANDSHTVPVMIFSTSNAVAAGIVTSVEKSGRDHVWAHMYPSRFKRQIEVFHDTFAFKRLGMVYEDSPAGRALAALSDAEELARERRFKIIRTFVKDNQKDRNRFFSEMLAAHRKLAGEVDAMYMTIYPGSRKFDMLPALMQPFYEKKIPVFTQLKGEVQFGALMSVADADFMGIGLFGAEAIISVLKGGSTRNLPQVYESTPYIVLNLEVAQKIGYRPPFAILLVADRLYRKIERP